MMAPDSTGSAFWRRLARSICCPKAKRSAIRNCLIWSSKLASPPPSEVTDLSGRGVGMDVVRRNIELLRGNIEIQSTEGQGTTITIRLPLTLAIIDGFSVIANNETYFIPLENDQRVRGAARRPDFQ